MDRDAALQLLTNLTAVNTAVTALATNTTPATPAALSMSRMESNDEINAGPDIPVEEIEQEKK